MEGDYLVSGGVSEYGEEEEMDGVDEEAVMTIDRVYKSGRGATIRQ